MKNDDNEMLSDSIKTDIVHLKKTCDQILLLTRKVNFRVDFGDGEIRDEMLRMKTVQLVKGILKPLVMDSVIYTKEYEIIMSNLTSLAKTGKLAPQREARLLTQQEVADRLGIGLSTFKKLDGMKVFPFKRKMVHSSVRYRSTDIDEYILAERVDEGGEDNLDNQ